MQLRKTFILIGLLLLGLVKLASAKTEFEPGKDYEQLNQQQTDTADKSNKVTVIEFFNYGCGACAFLEPKLNQWLQTKSAEINFEKIPVVFHSDWEFWAKSYYIAKALNMNSSLDPTIFNALHSPQKNERMELRSPAEMEALFVKKGAKPNAFSSAYKFSPTIDSEFQKGKQLMESYGITAIPAFIVNGHYKTDLRLASGNPDRMILILNFLIAKSKNHSYEHP